MKPPCADVFEEMEWASSPEGFADAMDDAFKTHTRFDPDPEEPTLPVLGWPGWRSTQTKSRCGWRTRYCPHKPACPR